MSVTDVHARLLDRLRRNQQYRASENVVLSPASTLQDHQRAARPPCAPERPLHSTFPGTESVALSMACHSHFAATRMRALIESMRASEPPLEIDSEFDGVTVRRLAPQTDVADWYMLLNFCLGNRNCYG